MTERSLGFSSEEDSEVDKFEEVDDSELVDESEVDDDGLQKISPLNLVSSLRMSTLNRRKQSLHINLKTKIVKLDVGKQIFEAWLKTG